MKNNKKVVDNKMEKENWTWKRKGRKRKLNKMRTGTEHTHKSFN